MLQGRRPGQQRPPSLQQQPKKSLYPLGSGQTQELPKPLPTKRIGVMPKPHLQKMKKGKRPPPGPPPPPPGLPRRKPPPLQLQKKNVPVR